MKMVSRTDDGGAVVIMTQSELEMFRELNDRVIAESWRDSWRYEGDDADFAPALALISAYAENYKIARALHFSVFRRERENGE